MRPSDAFDIHRSTIRSVVEANQARNPRVFGSVARRDDNDQSDVDLLVDTTGSTTLFDIAGIELELERLIGVPVHVTTTAALRGRLRDRILAEARAV
jgi:predicted nucleotidyltransferase